MSGSTARKTAPNKQLHTVTDQDGPKRFHFTREGVTYSLPMLGQVKVGITRKVRNLDPIDGMFTILEQVADAETLAVIDTLTMDEMAKIMAGWEKGSDVTLGE